MLLSFFHISIDIVGIVFNFTLLAAILLKTPQSFKSYAIILLNSAVADALAVIMDVFVLQRYLVLIRPQIPPPKLQILLFIVHIPMFFTMVLISQTQAPRDVILAALEKAGRRLDSETITGHIHYTEPLLVSAIIIISLVPSLAYSVIFAARYCVQRELKQQAGCMSTASRKNHRTLIKALTCHAAVPSVYGVGCALFLLVYYGKVKGVPLEYIMSIIPTIIPCVNPMLTLYFITPYRRLIFKFIPTKQASISTVYAKDSVSHTEKMTIPKSFFAGSWVNVNEDGVEEYFKAKGAPWIVRKAINAVTQTFTWTDLGGGKYSVEYKTPVSTTTYEFRLDEEFIGKRFDSSDYKILITVECDLIVQRFEKVGNSDEPVEVYTFGIEGDKMTMKRADLSYTFAVNSSPRRHSNTTLIPIVDPSLNDGTKKSKIIHVEPHETVRSQFEGEKFNLSYFEFAEFNPIVPLIVGPILARPFYLTCEKVVNEPGLIESLRDEHFDVMITENFDVCGMGISHAVAPKSVIGLSSAFVNGFQFAEFGVPEAISYVSAKGTASLDVHSFSSRFFNSLDSFLEKVMFFPTRHWIDGVLKKRFGPDYPSVAEQSANVAYFMTNSEPLIDFAGPTTSRHWEEVLTHRDRAVLISFGTVAESQIMPIAMKKSIAKTAARFPDTTFIWKYEVEDEFTREIASKVPNLVLTKWMPQVDLLNDAKVHLFVTHAGMGSTLEVAYRGVPGVFVPIFGDQLRNAGMMEHNGLGKVFPKSELVDDEKFSAVVREVLENEKYNVKAKEVARKLAAKPFSAKELLIKHVEFAAEFGPSPALRPQSVDMNFIEYNNLDIIVVFAVCAALFIFFFTALLCAMGIMKSLLIGIICQLAMARDLEIEMNAEQLINYWKYPFEEFTAQTEDEYILTLYRIKHGRNGTISGTSGKYCKFSYRGTYFSWDQMAEFDLPAAIDKVLLVTGAERVYYAGHSQGTTVLFGKLARDPAFTSKIARFFALAPITTAKYMKGPMTGLHSLQHFLQTHVFSTQAKYWVRKNTCQRRNIMETSCSNETPILNKDSHDQFTRVCPFDHSASLCESILSLMGGSSDKGVFNVVCILFNLSILVYIAHYPGTSSIRNFVHWGQMIWKDQTSMYDFGSVIKNQERYGQVKLILSLSPDSQLQFQSMPPVYDFTAIRNVSIHLFYSDNDLLASTEDVEKEMLVKHLKKEVVKTVKVEEVIKVPGYAHYDFIYGMTLKSEIFDKIIGRRTDSSEAYRSDFAIYLSVDFCANIMIRTSECFKHSDLYLVYGIMERRVKFLILASILHLSLATDPEEQIIKYWKYPFDEFTVQTDDGYVLTLYRITFHCFRNRYSCHSPPIVLAHGLGASAEHWLMNPPDSNPAFILADAGFDVWMINFRGAKNTEKHARFKRDSSEYWNFSWDQMSEFDLPAAINEILRVNGASRVYYVGHSQVHFSKNMFKGLAIIQGTTVMFGKLARNPSFSSKIARFFALAPITTARNIRGPMTALHYIEPLLHRSNEVLGGQEYVPPTQYVADLGWVCHYDQLTSICESILSMLGGSSGKGVLNITRALVYLSHYPCTSSKKNFAHWGQMIWSNQTRMYDHGNARKNQINYKQPLPPLYDFTSIRNVSIHIFYSSNDLIATAEDIEKEMIGKDLRNNVVKEELIKYWKYPFDQVVVQTDDGYLLTLFRIKHGRTVCSSILGPPFVLAHGLGASADHFLMNPPESNPAFILADAGFDVWLLNFRGAKYSKNHVQYNQNSSEFWRFSWDQMAQYDLPASIDAILRINGADRVYYAGHSQGTTILFAKLARDPEYTSKISRFFALAPIITSKYMRGPMTGLFFLLPILQQSEDMLGSREYSPLSQLLGDKTSDWFCTFAQMTTLCQSMIAVMGGTSEQGVFNATRSDVYLAHYSGLSSRRNFIHRAQMIWRDQTRMYDFGNANYNQFHYGQEAVKVRGYAHFDFIYGTTLKSVIFDRIINVISCWPNSKFTSSLSRYSSQQTSPGKLQELAQIVCMQRHLSPYTSLDCLAKVDHPAAEVLTCVVKSKLTK
uniref:glucuronosyltransferase n=1 Tax=Pristionchus pacificus TaxID=54126 RepID=A0A8R1UGZ8_PRIPA